MKNLENDVSSKERNKIKFQQLKDVGWSKEQKRVAEEEINFQKSFKESIRREKKNKETLLKTLKDIYQKKKTKKCSGRAKKDNKRTRNDLKK